MKTLRFSLIEVLLAMMLVSIGIMSIMGLIPIGVRAQRDAINFNQSADAADGLLHYLAYYMNYSPQGWDNLVGSIGDSDHVPVLPAYDVPWNDSNSADVPDQDDMKSYTADGTLDAPAEWVFRIVKQRDVKDPDTDAVIRKATEADFVMRVWKSQVNGWYDPDGTGASIQSGLIDSSKAIQLNIEVSWPGSAEYKYRTKAHYSLEVRREL